MPSAELSLKSERVCTDDVPFLPVVTAARVLGVRACVGSYYFQHYN